jgi:hypothetical protein
MLNIEMVAKLMLACDNASERANRYGEWFPATMVTVAESLNGLPVKVWSAASRVADEIALNGV